MKIALKNKFIFEDKFYLPKLTLELYQDGYFKINLMHNNEVL